MFALAYQKIIYNAASIPNTITAPTANPPCGLNIDESISRPFLFSLGPMRLRTIMIVAQKRRTKPILSRDGISYNPLSALSFENPNLLSHERSANFGRNFNRIDSGNVITAATRAAVAVVLFQK